MKKLITTFFSLSLFALSQVVCAQSDVVRSLTNFTAVDSKGSVDVYLTRGNENSVRLEYRNISEHEIITEVSGNTLKIYIDTDRKLLRNHGVKAYVTYKNLESIYSSGSGDVECNSEIEADNVEISTSGSGNILMNKNVAGDMVKIQTKGSGDLTMASAGADEMIVKTHGSGDLSVSGSLGADELTLATNGSGNIRANVVNADYIQTSIAGSGDINIGKGTADQIDVTVRGSGDLKAYDFMAQQAEIDISGSGDVAMGVDRELAVSIRGSGDVKYKGNGVISRIDIKGSGSVNKM